MTHHKLTQGFTLIEILIALFMTTIVSLMLIQALHHLIALKDDMTQKRERLHELQIAFFKLSHDLEATVNQPASGQNTKPTANFMGNFSFIQLTRTMPFNFANNTSPLFEREQYTIENHALWLTTNVTENNQTNLSHKQKLLSNIMTGHFEYLGEAGQFYRTWPPPNQPQSSLPHAIRVLLTLSQFGSISQLYVIQN